MKILHHVKYLLIELSIIGIIYLITPLHSFELFLCVFQCIVLVEYISIFPAKCYFI